MYFKERLIAYFTILFIATFFLIRIADAKDFEGDDLKIFSSSQHAFARGCVCLKGLEPKGVKLSSYLCGMSPNSGCDTNRELGNDLIGLNEQKCYAFKGKFIIRKAGKAKVVDYKTDERNCGEGQLNMLN